MSGENSGYLDRSRIKSMSIADSLTRVIGIRYSHPTMTCENGKEDSGCKQRNGGEWRETG